VRLARLDGDDALEARARAVVADAGDLPARAPTAFGNILCVASALLSDIETVVIAGRADDAAARALGRAAVAASGPETIIWLDPARVTAPDAPPAAYVCRGSTCLPPVVGADELRTELNRP
jgi:uncharacterized protein YyaL (SSP411 family)